MFENIDAALTALVDYVTSLKAAHGDATAKQEALNKAKANAEASVVSLEEAEKKAEEALRVVIAELKTISVDYTIDEPPPTSPTFSVRR